MNYVTHPNAPPAVEPGAVVIERQREATETPVLVQYWDAIYRRKILIIAIIAASLALGVLLTAMMTPQYTATSRIEISRKQENVTDMRGVEPEEEAEAAEFYQTQYGLLRARSLAERVARRLNLAADEGFFELFDVELASAEGGARVSAADRNRRQRMAASILLSNIVVAPIRGSALVDVEFRSPNPELSARVVNTWVDEFIRSNLDRRFSSTADARAFLERRLAELRQRLENTERQLVTYAANKQIVPLSRRTDAEGNTTNERTLVSADLEALNTALAEATAARVTAQSEVGRGNNRDIIANPTIAALRERRATVAADYARVLSQFERGYPVAQALESQLQQLDRSIAAEEARVRGSVQTRLQEAVRREADLRSRVDALTSRLLRQESDTIQYNIFQRDVDTTRQLYDALLQRYREIGVAGVGANTIAVVDRAEVPSSPSSPSLPLNLTLALLLGMAVSGASVFALEQIDQSLKDPADLPRLLGLPFLGAVPLVQGQILEELKDRKSVPSEAYFSIQTNLSFLTDHGAPKSFLVTSTRAGEGKSSSTAALGEILTRVGKRVVIVDADMRNPSVHKLFDVDNDKGLSNYLSGEDNYRSTLHATANERLWLMTAGPTPPNAAELLSSDRMRKLITTLGGDFDHVLVDAPPVLGIADIPLLVGTVEGVIYTIEAGGAKVRAIRSALQRLRAVNANIFGAIVTKLDARNPSYGYGYGYGYGYSYGQRKDGEPRA